MSTRAQKAAQAARQNDGVNVISKGNEAAVSEAEAILRDPNMAPGDVEIVEDGGEVHHVYTSGDTTVSTRYL